MLSRYRAIGAEHTCTPFILNSSARFRGFPLPTCASSCRWTRAQPIWRPAALRAAGCTGSQRRRRFYAIHMVASSCAATLVLCWVRAFGVRRVVHAVIARICRHICDLRRRSAFRYGAPQFRAPRANVSSQSAQLCRAPTCSGRSRSSVKGPDGDQEARCLSLSVFLATVMQ